MLEYILFFTKNENGIHLIDEWLQFNMNECKQRKWSFKRYVYKQKFFDHLYNIVKDYKICFGDWSSSKTPNAKGQRGPNRNIFQFFTKKCKYKGEVTEICEDRTSMTCHHCQDYCDKGVGDRRVGDGTLEDMSYPIDKDQLKIPKERSFKMENIFKMKPRPLSNRTQEDIAFRQERKEHNLEIKNKLKKGLIKLKISERKQKKLDQKQK